MKTLIIEDDYEVIKKITEKLKGSDITIFPSTNDPSQKEDKDFSNYANLNQIYNSDESLIEQKFNQILDELKDVNLFIVDIALKGDEDILGVKFINFVKKKRSDYNNGNYKMVVLSQYGKQSNQIKKIDNKTNIEFIHKQNYGGKGDYTDILAKFINENFNIEIKNGFNKKTGSKEKFFENLSFWSDKIISIVFGFLILVCLSYSIIGISKETYQNVFLSFNHNSNSTIITNLKMQTNIQFEIKQKESTTYILEFVEHMFLFLLPIFVILGFYNYYRLTTGVILKGGPDSEIDHDEAIKSLNTSKTILLSTLLSFAIIKILDNVLNKNEINTTSLIAYGILLLILMSYIILQTYCHRNERKCNKIKINNN